VNTYYRPLLCVGGPLDGQYRVLDGDVSSFRATIPLPPGVPASGRGADTSVEYLRIWSREHGRFVWWYAS
jgi:hypothetical protein